MRNAAEMNRTATDKGSAPAAGADDALVAYVTEDVAVSGVGNWPGAHQGELTPRGFTRVVLRAPEPAPRVPDPWQAAAVRTRGGHRPAPHPGILLREDVVPAFGLRAAEIARLLGITPQALQAILNERAPVTAEIALRLGKLCGNGPELWLGLQARYDLERLSESRRAELAAIPTLAA
ncbi:MAG: HigA family addiction module antitoxin [Alphaproteobacteria bacterium]